MALYMDAPERKGTYIVKKDFRFGGRNLVAGQEFNARRLDPTRGRLDSLYRDGYLSLPDEEADEAYRKRRQQEIDSWQPPQPAGEPADKGSEAAPSNSHGTALEASAKADGAEAERKSQTPAPSKGKGRKKTKPEPKREQE